MSRARSRWWRWLARLAVAAAALVLLAGGALWFLLGTRTGARWLFTRVGGMMTGSLEVAELDGPIRGPLSIRGLTYRSDSVEVRIERLALDWRLGELLDKRLDVVRLAAEGVRVRLAAGGESAGPQALPDVHLPVNIIVRQARVRDLEIAQAAPAKGAGTGGAPPLAEPVRIDAIDLATRTRGDVVTIDRLTVASPEIAARVSGRVEPVGDYPVDLALDWSADLPGQPRFAGRGTFSGTLERLRVVQELRAPAVARLDARLTRPLRDLRFDATVAVRPFPLRRLGETLPAATVGGRLHATGSVDAFRARGRLTAPATEYGPLRADLEVVRDGPRWRFDRLGLSSPAAATRLEAGGELVLPAEGEPRFDLDASWSDLVWPLTGEPSVRSPRGRASVAGTAADYRLRAAGRLVAAGLPPTPLDLVGHGDRDGLAVERLRAGLLRGQVTARGEVTWSPRVAWRLAMDGRGLDPEALWPDGPGKLALEAETSGHLEDAGPVGRVAPLHLAGTLRGEPFTARGALRLDGERIALPPAEVHWGSLRLAARGRLAPSWDLGFDLTAPNLAVALPDAAGELEAHGHLGGPQATPRIQATVRGNGLEWGASSAHTLDATADVDLAPAGRLAVDARATEVASGGRTFGAVSVGAHGTRAHHRITATVDAPAGGLRLAAVGSLDEGGAWRGEVTTLAATLPDAGSWSLAAPAALRASSGQVELSRLCEVSGEARLCARGGWRGAGSAGIGSSAGRPASQGVSRGGGQGGWHLAAELTALPLSLAQAVLPPDVAIRGRIGGRIEASSAAGGGLTARADLAPGPGALDYPVPAGDVQTVRFGEGRVTASADASGAHATLRLPLPELGHVDAELTLPGWRGSGAPAGDQPLAARLDAEITDLGFLQAFSEEVDDTAGHLQAHLRVAGTVGHPRLGGSARLEDGRATVPSLGIELTKMNLAATGEGDHPTLSIQGSVSSGDGTLELHGQAPPAPAPGRPIRVAIQGERFEAMNTPEVHLLASPDLEMTYDGQRLGLTGEVRVPKASVDVAKPPPGVVTASDDVVYVGGGDQASPTPGATSLPLAMRVRAVLGDDVKIDVLGLKAKPTGSLLLMEAPDRPTTAIGEIDLAGGTFKAYGQDLTIERGRLAFNGPVDNPRVDLRAYRKASDGVTAGLEAKGPLEKPEITLWSDPAMDQSDQLAYILLGHPLGRASSSEGSLVARAATTMGLKGGNLLARRLGARFGLEEARIETSGGLDQASLVLGKYLSPRLYVAYGVGLFEAANTLRIRYLLSSRWTLQATTGAAQGADLLYTIERGRGARQEVPSGPADLRERKVPAGR